MGLIFFYTTFFGIPLARKKRVYQLLLSALLLVLLVFFATPAMRFGFWQVMSSIVPHVIIIFLAAIFRRFSDSLRLEKERNDLLLQQAKSELAILKMKVGPHFLFNTLNNIDYLVFSDPGKASQAIVKLGEILRYQIYETESEMIPLTRELVHLEDYLELERLRIPDKGYLQYSLTGVPGHLQIAPMLFLPLVENAFKHVLSREGEDRIRIRIQVEDHRLSFSISNAFDPARKQGREHNGQGINLVKRRLELIYPDRHQLNIRRNNERFEVDLTIELDEY